MSSNPKSLKNRISGVRVEPGLEFCEQFARDRRDVLHTGHGQQDALGAGVERHLQGFGEILDWHNIPTEAHAAQDDHLLLDRLGQRSRTQGDKRRQVIAVVGPVL